MPKLDLDSLFEPIEITLDGETYTIIDVSEDQLKALDVYDKKNGKDEKEKDLDPHFLSKQLSILLSVDQSKFKTVGVRKLSRAVNFIQSEIMGSAEDNPKKKDLKGSPAS